MSGDFPTLLTYGLHVFDNILWDVTDPVAQSGRVHWLDHLVCRLLRPGRGGGERERDRDRQTERQTDRQTDRDRSKSERGGERRQKKKIIFVNFLR